MTANTLATEPDVPFPPRYWWLKRLLASVVLFASVMVALWFAWRWYADRKLGAELRAIHDRGEPIYIEDFAPKAVPDELNGAKSLEDAATAVGTMPQNLTDFLDRHDFEFAPDEQDKKNLQQIATASMPSRQLARRARFQLLSAWSFRLGVPGGAMFPPMNRQRELTTLLSCVAKAEHLAGHDAEAIETIRDILSLSDRTHENGPSLISHLVAIGMSSAAAYAVRDIVTDLAVLPGSGSTTQPGGFASREQVRELIAAFLDDGKYRRGFAMGMAHERFLQQAAARDSSGVVGALNLSSPSISTLLKPAMKLEVIGGFKMIDQLAAASTKENRPAAFASLPTLYSEGFAMSSVATRLCMLVSLVSTPSSATLEAHFRGITERRVAAIRLAIRLYQIDHAGALPASLDELVPNYLAALPADPYAAIARPFGYRIDPKPLLYSVGKDGKDDGADSSLSSKSYRLIIQPIEPGSPQDDMNWDRRDVIFPLNEILKPAPPPPATEPGE